MHVMPENSHRLQRAQTGLLVVDIQERLLPAIYRKEQIARNASRLAQGAASLGIPILATEQYRKGLGPTIPEVAGAIPGFAPIEKLAFSACGAAGFLDDLRGRGLKDIIVCGMECHVCVCQTCLDLLDHGFRPFVVADAVSSRTPQNHRMGLDRMQSSGVIIVSLEMALFELLERAGTDEFKRVLSLIK